MATNVADLLAEGVWGPVRPGAWDAVGQEEGRAHLTSYVATKTGRDIHLQSSYLPLPPSQSPLSSGHNPLPLFPPYLSPSLSPPLSFPSPPQKNTKQKISAQNGVVIRYAFEWIMGLGLIFPQITYLARERTLPVSVCDRVATTTPPPFLSIPLRDAIWPLISC